MENIEEENKTPKVKKQKLSKLVGTFFRNSLRSNLDLTSLADTKAGILISINGFILTVSVTASGFAVHNLVMTYAFISIILTSLGSIILAVLAVKPRSKDRLVKKEHLEGYGSLLYYQDMADLDPAEYSKQMKDVLACKEKSTEEMITHLHILGAEIKKKYFWLKQAYTFFSIGLTVSATLIVYALVSVEHTPFYNLSKGNVVYTKNSFYNVFEPSGATTMPDGKVLIVEDESSAQSLKLVEVQGNSKIVELGSLYLPKKIKKVFKKEIEDLEAITSDKNTVFAITSHTLNKSKQQRNTREKFVMFTYEDGAIIDFHMYANLKQDLMKSFPDLLVHDINIEGLCFDSKNKTLLIGFRSPLKNKKAMILTLKNPKALFLKGENPEFLEPIWLDIQGMGIRDIHYDSQKDAYWIIAGDSSERGNNFQLWFWNPKDSELSLVKNQPDIGYAEGITLINKNSNIPALLIVEDNGKKPNKSADYIIIDRESL